ncbi:MAG: glycosyltransferase [Ghiorsea sp.]
MIILHIITRMDAGGSAVNTLITASEQRKSGHEVTLAYGAGLDSNMSDAEQTKVDEGVTAFLRLGGVVHVLEHLKREVGLHDNQAVKDIRALGMDDFDIIHTHTSKAGALGRYAAAKSSAKVVHTPHGHIFHGYFGELKTKMFLKVEQHLAKKTDVLIALTKAERDDHLKLGVGTPEQWVVVPSGVDVEAIAEWVWEHPVSVEHKPWDVVSVGRLVPIKGMERLIAAWSVVVQSKSKAMLALVGDGEEKRSLEKLASRYNIIPNVTFLGWSDPLPELSKAKTFALLSHNEGMGRAVVEAMAAGLPCVVSDVCGLRELVDDSVGRVVDAEDKQAVANALMTDWPRDISRATRARADNYSIVAMMKGLNQAYEKALSFGKPAKS